ncbi:MAG: GNAT family N-acetyltransferase [Polyangia bacterium]
MIVRKYRRIEGSPGRLPGITPRPARVEEAGQIAVLLRDCAPQCLPVERNVIERRIGEYRVLRAFGRVIGAAALHPLDDGGERCELRSVAVDPEWKGRGLGSRLVDWATECATREGFELLCVTCRPRFFAHAGFSRTERARVPEKAARAHWPVDEERVAMAWDGPRGDEEDGRDEGRIKKSA